MSCFGTVALGFTPMLLAHRRNMPRNDDIVAVSLGQVLLYRSDAVAFKSSIVAPLVMQQTRFRSLQDARGDCAIPRAQANGIAFSAILAAGLEGIAETSTNLKWRRRATSISFH